MKWIVSNVVVIAAAMVTSCDAFRMPQDPSATRRAVFESVTKSAFGILVPSIAISNDKKAFALAAPFAGPQGSVLLGLGGESSVSAPYGHSTMVTTMSSPLEGSSTLLSEYPKGPRDVLINTRSTIMQDFPDYIENLQFTQLLNSYNSFNTPTRNAASTLAAAYNQQARKTTLFNAMTAMANAAMAQNQALCNNKMQATLAALNDFLKYVGSEGIVG